MSAAPPQAEEEVDVWWGSYSGWTMMPSLLVCIALTGLIAWFTWVTFRGGRSGFVQLTFLSLAGSVWILQTLRWVYRSCSYNYRLTTLRLFRDRGFGTKYRRVVELAGVSDVRIRRSFHERLVGVGRVYVFLLDKPKQPLILDGVRQPRAVADLIRAHANKAGALMS